VAEAHVFSGQTSPAAGCYHYSQGKVSITEMKKRRLSGVVSMDSPRGNHA